MASSTGGPGARPPPANISGQMLLLFALMISMLVLFDQNLRQSLGEIVGIGLAPIVGFGGDRPILTLLLTGLVMSFFSIVVRHFFMDWIEQARNARMMSAFQKEMRDARTSNNTFKLKKLTEMQPQMMSKSLKTTQTQFKLMPFTMIVVVPIFAWLSNFVYFDVSSTSFSVPWEFNADMKGQNLLPNWVLLYSLLTLPFGQVLTRVLKYFTFGKKLRNLEQEGEVAREVQDDQGEETGE
ncbi:MAG: hypothetical protein A3K60_00650 [Euryarchaeota archaeon RBG_19FT_COMBO_56_21]|nr:MAG: hypothetical protein A3K60_00650 [Euryarchaeota archaeon RBG_19FT_COMBO_56_21]